MKIERILRYGSFSYDDEGGILSITDREGRTVELNKTYSFALHRFFTRITQRNWHRAKPKPVISPPPSEISESDELIHAEQTEIEFVHEFSSDYNLREDPDFEPDELTEEEMEEQARMALTPR